LRDALTDTLYDFSPRKKIPSLLTPLGGQAHNIIGEITGGRRHFDVSADSQVLEIVPDSIFQTKFLTCLWVIKRSCEILISSRKDSRGASGVDDSPLLLQLQASRRVGREQQVGANCGSRDSYNLKSGKDKPNQR
jgi:hypothetical protein